MFNLYVFDHYFDNRMKTGARWPLIRGAAVKGARLWIEKTGEKEVNQRMRLTSTFQSNKDCLLVAPFCLSNK